MRISTITNKLRNLSLRSKLTAVIMATCVAALLLAGTALILWGWVVSRKTMVRGLTLQAEMLADNCKAALVFRDSKDATETLSSLSVDPSIIFGCVHDKDGVPFRRRSPRSIQEYYP